MPVSKTRKKRGTAPARIKGSAPAPMIPAGASPARVAAGLVTNTAQVLMQHARLFEDLVADHPGIAGTEDARLKLRVAALAICDAVDALEGRPMTYETMNEEQAA